MTILIAALLASQALPWIDRASLDTIAKIESLRTDRAAAAQNGRRPRFPAAKFLLTRDLRAITTVCSAAGTLPNPVTFLTDLGEAYAMSQGEIGALRETCAVYLSGQAEGSRRPKLYR